MINIQHLYKAYQLGPQTLTVLQDVSLTIDYGEFVAIMGQSGSGKSTLMNIIGLLDIPNQGSYCIDGQETATLKEHDRSQLRNAVIGFVFQQYNLLPRLPLVKQVALPLSYQGLRRHEREEKAKIALTRVGLGERTHSLPNELSGGQQQRVAIARALVTNPKLILADEPTGALDTRTGDEIMTLFRELNQAGKTIVMVTHEPSIADCAQRTIHIRDGQIII